MRDEYTASGHHRDYAQRIRNEQMTDAMPTAEEAKRKKREHLADEGCRECGEDDPNRLDYYGEEYPQCRGVQQPENPFVVLCEDHADVLPSLEEKAHREIVGAREDDSALEPDAVVFYTCRNWTLAHPPTVEEERHTGWTDDGDPIFESEVYRDPHEHAKIPIKCVCDAPIDRVIYKDDFESLRDDADTDEEERP